ncbi:MAG TPA: PQQ-dependent sugar dehydrogenase, partial [Candidatus Methylacidiphilales bacterium]
APAPAPVAAAKPTADDPADWRRAAPGTRYRIRPDALPEPFATRSAGNPPKTVPRPDGANVSVPPGFAVALFASGLSNPRVIRTAPNGDLFVAETGAKRIRVLRAADGAAAPSENRIFAANLDRPFGIAFYPPGPNPQWVYVANNNSVVRFAYRNGDLAATAAPEVVVPRLEESAGGHSTRDIAFSLDGKRLFISVGSGSNIGEGMGPKTPEEIAQWEAEHGRGAAWGFETNRALILVCAPDGSGLKTYATGIRNGVGLAVHPETGDLWTSTNERDGLGDDLVPDYVTRVKEGGFYGWPWYYIGRHEEPRLKGARPDLASEVLVPDVLVQAHSASLAMTFYPLDNHGPAAFPESYRGCAFAAFHGSWNRTTRTGYKVVRIFVEHGVPTGEYEDFLTGFVVDDASVWGRPVGVTVAKDGALLVTEDGNGTIWRVAPVK